MQIFDKRFFIFLLFIIALPILTTLMVKTEMGGVSGVGSPMVGEQVPDFTVETLAGEKLNIRDVVGRKVLLINLWATFCAPCREEMPLLNSVFKALDPNRFEMVSLMEDEGSKEQLQELLSRFQKTTPVDFKVYLDSRGDVAQMFGTYKVPETFLVDLNGKVIEHYVGAIHNRDRNKLLQRIQSAMAGR